MPDDMVDIVVDGRAVQARPGELLIAAAERAGTYIPRFCYHPRMKPVGMCRMCLVEVGGPRGFSLQPACYMPVTDGMEVLTSSPKVKKAQDGVLEYLLANHPLDCPVCDKGGECPLQDQTIAYGPGESRFVEEKRHFAKPIPVSDLVLLDRERCIQCDRCTRFAKEVAGDPLIQFVGRGDQIRISTFPGHPFASYFSGNTVQICPVGALTAVPYRFKARPWDLEEVESTCTSCAVGCRVAVQSTTNRLIRYLGVDSDPVNHGWLCDKGRFDFEAVNSDQRVVKPLVREGDELVEASWSEALARAAKGLADLGRLHGPQSVGVLGGARLANEDAYAWAKLAKSVLRTDSVDAQLADGLAAEVVLGLPRATIDEACSARVLVLVCPDLREELPVLYLRLREAAVDNGLPVVELAPAATAMTPHSSVSLRYRPGEAAARAADVIAEVRRLLAPCDGEGAAQGGAHGAPEVVVVLGRPSLAEQAGTIAAAAAQIAAAFPQAAFLPALRRANVHGALDMGLAPGVLPGRVGLEDGRSWFEAAWGALPESRGLDATGVLAAAAEGRPVGLVLLGCDPLSDFPDRDLARRAVDGAGFVVAVDAFLTPSSRRADVVLPAAMYAERAGTTTNIEGRVTRLAQKLVPPGVARADWMIASSLAAALGADLGFDSLEGIWDEIHRLAPAYGGIDLELLGRGEGKNGVVAKQERGGSANGRPATLELSTPPAPPGLPPADSYSLRLISGRSLYDRGTLVQASPSLAGLVPRSRVRANPYDLDRLGLATGDPVRITSARAALVLEAEADAGVPRGSAFVPFNLTGAGAAELIDVMAPVTDVRLETPS